MNMSKFGIRKVVFIVFLVGLLVTLLYISDSYKNEQNKYLRRIQLIEKSKQLPTYVVYNKVPKCGSTMLSGLLSSLKNNGFTRIRSNHKKPYYFPARKTLAKQNSAQLATTRKIIEKTNKNILFIEHTYFVSLDIPKVAYINQIRDPIKRLHSTYCYFRDMTSPYKKIKYKNRSKNWLKNTGWDKYENPAEKWLKTPLGQCIQELSIGSCLHRDTYFRTILHFCGTAHICRNPDTDAAMNLAIANIDKFYSVVGVLEEMKKSLVVMEAVLPGYFKGIGQQYEEWMKQNDNVRNKCMANLTSLEDPEDPTYQRLRRHLRREYRVYHHVLHKLNQQYNNITNVQK